jgi:dTDP-glucose 4,6-dehydratase
MRIIVTGSRGVVGSKLINELRNNNHHKILGIDHKHSEDTDYRRVDICKYRELLNVIEDFRPQIIYHAAAEFGRWNGEHYYENLWQTNVIGTRHILELQKLHKFRIIHFSSSEIYGEYPGTITEEIIEDPHTLKNDYAISKWVNEQQIKNIGSDAVIVRLFNTYGPGEYYSPYRSVICRFCYSLLTGQPIGVYTKHKRSFIYIDDAIQALTGILDKYEKNQTFNIASSVVYTMKEVAGIFKNICPYAKITELDYETDTVINKVADNSKIVERLDFKESCDLKSGIEKTFDWMKSYYGLG